MANDTEFEACINHVKLINGAIIDPNDDPTGEGMLLTVSVADKKPIMQESVDYLEIQVASGWYAGDFETREAPANKTSIEAAIAAGKAYIGA